MPSQIREDQWAQLSEVIARSMGLHFPRERWDDLQRGLTGAAQEFGIEDVSECIGWLLSAPPTKVQLQVLASHLTIGETYFLRDRQTLEALTGHILPELLRARRGREQRLRIWSAACCSGEEPYSLAILLHKTLPDLRDWHVTITATDINGRFLHKAVVGAYGEWSFRNAPPWLKQRYFERTADGRYTIIPEIRKLVTFEHLNLVDDVYPSLATDTNAMDVIFCRNVLMYFTPPQIQKVAGKLHQALVGGGWLAVSPSEASKAMFPQFTAVNFSGAILLQKNGAASGARPIPALPEPVAEYASAAFEETLPVPPIVSTHARIEDQGEPAPAGALSVDLTSAKLLYREGRYAEAADTLLAAFAGRPPEPAACSLLARALANQGNLADALVWCERWIAADKMDAAGHYLRAVVLLEQGDAGQARTSLQRSLYLDQDFVLAHFALGNLARGRGQPGEANRHFANALDLLRRYQPEDLLPESDGLTAGRLAETLTTMTDAGNPHE